MKYSPSTNSFYLDPEQDGADVPDDLIDVSDAEYAAWLSAPSGSTISVENGKIVITSPVTEEEVTTGAAYRYSPSTGLFYLGSSTSTPDDAVDVSAAEYAEWTAAASGSTITVEDGKIVIHLPAAEEEAVTLSEYRFSATTGCFYPVDLDYADLPADLVDVSANDFATCMAAAAGSTFTVSNGSMIVIPPAAVTDDQRAASLKAYAESQRKRIADGGITVNVGTTDAPINCAVDTSVSGLGNLYAMQMRALANQSGSFTWYQSSGNIAVTADNISTIAAEVGSFIDMTFAALDAVKTAIEAGSVTTTAEIDAAGWPANS